MKTENHINQHKRDKNADNRSENKGDNNLESLADEIKNLGEDLRFNAGAQLLFGGLLLNKYISLRAKKHYKHRSHLDIMHSLILHGGSLKPTELSKILFRSKQNITGILDNLERDGLVKRELIGKDRRTRRVRITSKGLEAVRASLPTTQDIVKCSMPGLSEDEMHILGDILKRIIKHLLAEIKKEDRIARVLVKSPE